jgi:hypothetical protein
MSPLSDPDDKVRIDGIEFAARMAFDGKLAVHILNHISSLDTYDIRGLIN